MKVWFDGAVVEPAQARVSVFDHGLLYGDGVFEGIRIRGGRVFRLNDHLDRFEASAEAIGLDVPGGRDAARRACLESARALDHDEAYLRLVLTRGEGPLGIDPTTCPRGTLFCIAGSIALFDESKRHVGIDMITSWWRRPSSDVLDPRVKSLNYLNNVMAKREAKLYGADEALVLNASGRVAEASGANLFAVRRGELLTPPVSEGALEGVTRRSVLEIAPELGLPAREIPLARADLLDAEEVFLTGSGAGVTRVGSLDGVRIGARKALASPLWAERVLEALVAFAARVGTPFRVQ